MGERWIILIAMVDTSGSRNHKENPPIEDGVRMVELIDAAITQAQRESRCRPPENCSTKDSNRVRTRALSRVI